MIKFNAKDNCYPTMDECARKVKQNNVTSAYFACFCVDSFGLVTHRRKLTLRVVMIARRALHPCCEPTISESLIQF